MMNIKPSDNVAAIGSDNVADNVTKDLSVPAVSGFQMLQMLNRARELAGSVWNIISVDPSNIEGITRQLMAIESNLFQSEADTVSLLAARRQQVQPQEVTLHLGLVPGQATPRHIEIVAICKWLMPRL